MTEPTSLQDLLWIRLIADDPSIPANEQQWHNKTVGLARTRLDGMGSGEDDPGKLLGVRGYPRTAADGVTEFVMIPGLDRTTATHINKIPGSDGWKDPTSRTVYRAFARMLTEEYRIPLPIVRNNLTALYNAAVTNDKAPPKEG